MDAVDVTAVDRRVARNEPGHAHAPCLSGRPRGLLRADDDRRDAPARRERGRVEALRRAGHIESPSGYRRLDEHAPGRCDDERGVPRRCVHAPRERREVRVCPGAADPQRLPAVGRKREHATDLAAREAIARRSEPQRDRSRHRGPYLRECGLERGGRDGRLVGLGRHRYWRPIETRKRPEDARLRLGTVDDTAGPGGDDHGPEADQPHGCVAVRRVVAAHAVEQPVERLRARGGRRLDLGAERARGEAAQPTQGAEPADRALRLGDGAVPINDHAEGRRAHRVCPPIRRHGERRARERGFPPLELCRRLGCRQASDVHPGDRHPFGQLPRRAAVGERADEGDERENADEHETGAPDQARARPSLSARTELRETRFGVPSLCLQGRGILATPRVVSDDNQERYEGRSVHAFRMYVEMTRRWISDVPSTIWSTFASRNHFSTG